MNMDEELIEKIVSMDIQKEDAVNAIELGKEVKAIDSLVFNTDTEVAYGKKIEDDCALSFNFENVYYEIWALNLKKRIERVEFPIHAGDIQKPLTKEEKIFLISASEVRSRLQLRGIEIFKPGILLTNRNAQKILDSITFLRKEICSKRLFSWEIKDFDKQFITAMCLYYLRKDASPEELIKLITFNPKRLKKRHP